MRATLLVIASFWVLAACGDKSPGTSICDNTVPPPAACMTQCDPAPGAPNTCPAGYHCAPDGYCDALCTSGGGECGDGYTCTADGRCQGQGECVGLECNIVDCVGQGKPDTTLKGTVYAPNGTLPLYGVNVYVPNAALPPMTDGAECARCNAELPGSPVVRTVTDEAGNFTLTGVPAGQDIPLVIASGKWRRVITIPSVSACGDNSVPTTETRFPKNKSEGDMPRIAVTTGSADALECLLPKLGIDLAEITTDTGNGRIHLYSDDGLNSGRGEDRFMGGQRFGDAATLWNSLDNLKTYDIVFFSCEGRQGPETKSQAAMDAVKAYADFGGRIFLSHWHNIWIEGARSGGTQAPAVWPDIATWGTGSIPENVTDIIDEVNNPKGASFATWMENVGGSMTRGEIPVAEARATALDVDVTKGERWVYYQSGGQAQYPQMFQFTTPNEAPIDQRCGKVVFSDMHVAAGSSSSPGSDAKGYPDDCSTGPLTPQEKALAFMFFDLATCISVIL